MPDIVNVKISGLKSWQPANSVVTHIRGGVANNGPGPDPYDAGPTSAPLCPATKPTLMCWSSTLSGTDTVIKLYNSPLRAPIESGPAGSSTSGRGLAVEDRLYGLEYIPSPLENLTTGGVQFSTDLTAPMIGPKNTARWIINIPAAAIPNDTQITIETRIGDQLTSGVMYPKPDRPSNLSRTYVWRGSDAYIFGNVGTTPPALPITERYQFLGDPRHLPYADLKRPHISGTFPSSPAGSVGNYESPLGMGYNRYFDDFEDTTFNRGQSAEQTGLGLEKWTIDATVPNNVARFIIDGAPAFSVSIADGTFDAAGIASALNADATFASAATAVAVSGHVRVISRTLAGSSVQYDMTDPTAAVLGAQLGFAGSVSSNAGWPGWVYTVAGTSYGVKNNGIVGDSGWETNGGRIEIDVHRLFQVLRSALVNSSAIYTTMTGFSYYYIGIGNEIGYDAANVFPNSVPVSTMPFTGAAGGIYENSITGTVKLIRENTNNGWWAKPWIGELYPDSQYSTAWNTTGNIPTGQGANLYVRDVRANFPKFWGTALTNAVRRTKERGCTTFFWGGKPGATFHHGYYDSDSAAIQTPGQDIADHYSMPVPATIANARPFDVALNNTGDEPESFLAGGYPPAYNIKSLRTYYLHSGGGPTLGSALVTLTDPNSNYPAFIAVNGLSPTGVSGTTFIAKWSFLSLIQSFFNGGLYTDTTASPKAMHIRQVPRVVITAPNDQTNLKKPTTITVGWDSTWVRWDGLNYTVDPLYANWVENLTLKFAVLYSTTNGIPDKSKGSPTGWFYMQDDTPAPPGQKPDSAHEISQAISMTKTSNTYTWSVPAGKFPEANYVIRVESYREGYPLHYAFHQYRAFIQRN
jgi:hypothetical protein